MFPRPASCSRITRRPADRATRVKDRWGFRGSTGRPVRVAKTRSDSRQVSPSRPRRSPSLPGPCPPTGPCALGPSARPAEPPPCPTTRTPGLTLDERDTEEPGFDTLRDSPETSSCCSPGKLDCTASTDGAGMTPGPSPRWRPPGELQRFRLPRYVCPPLPLPRHGRSAEVHFIAWATAVTHPTGEGTLLGGAQISSGGPPAVVSRRAGRAGCGVGSRRSTSSGTPSNWPRSRSCASFPS